MLSETLAKGLSDYAIGEKLRALRLKKKMGLVELGRHTGLSAAMLSKVERGKLFPTLPTLLRIALVFSVGLEYFFSNDQKRHVLGIVRLGERKRFPERPDGRDISFYFESLDFAAVERKLNAYYAEFQPLQPGKARLHHHAGVEFLSVLRGNWNYKSERKTTFSNPGTRSISIPRCHTPTEESVRNHVVQSSLPRRKLL
ncbi:MAG TPA: helix-turn-helix domain-containing protein [Candidatus Acidoferrum sp.]|nr:helix-turn-helix domain-containing protein [Candidatus Acidoferrum sp.]